MAQDAEALLLYLSADLRRFERSMEKAAGIADKKFNEIERRQREADKKLAAFGSELGSGLQKSSLLATAALGAIGYYSVELAKDAEETKNAFVVAFGAQAKAAEAFADTLANRVGRDVVELQGNMAQLRLVLDGVGLSGEQSLGVVEKLTARAVDIGSLFNVSDVEAYRAIISGITGETEPLKRFGVVLNDAALEAELLRLGFKGTSNEASEATKAIARTNIILERTSKAHDDAAKTAESLANEQKRARAEFNEAARKLGTALIPAMTEATEGAAALANTIGDMPTSLQVAGLGMLALVAAGGPIMSLITGFLRLREAAIAAAAASAAVGGGGAGKLATAGRAVAGATGIGALAVVTADVQGDANRRGRVARNPGKASDADLLAARNKGKQFDFGSGREKKRQARIDAEIKRRGLDKAQGIAGLPAVDPSALALDAALLKPIGGKSGGAGKKGPSAESLAKRAAAAAEKAAREAEQRAREQLERERDLADALDSVASRELSAREAGARTAEERYALAQERRAMDRAETEEARERAVQDGRMTQAQAERLNALDASVDVLEEANDRGELNRELEERVYAAREEIFRMAADALDVEAGMARTLQQRADVERRILALAQAEERDRLEQQIARGEVLNPEAARYNLGTRQAGQRAGLDQQQAQEAQTERFGGQDPRRNAEGVAAGVLEQDSAADRFAAETARIGELEAERTLTHEQAERARAQISAAYNEQRLAGYQSFFGALAGLQESGNAKLRAIGKAAAITQATIDGVLAVQKALSSAPPPLNFAIAAAVGATAALNVAKIAGFESGGYTGSGGRKKVAGVVHGGEYVVRKDVTDQHRETLEHLNRTGKLPGYASGGFVMPRAPRLPNMERLTAIGAVRSGAANDVRLTLNLEGANGDETIRRLAAEAAMTAFVAARRQVPADLSAHQRQRIPSRT